MEKVCVQKDTNESSQEMRGKPGEKGEEEMCCNNGENNSINC